MFEKFLPHGISETIEQGGMATGRFILCDDSESAGREASRRCSRAFFPYEGNKSAGQGACRWCSAVSSRLASAGMIRSRTGLRPSVPVRNLLRFFAAESDRL